MVRNSAKIIYYSIRKSLLVRPLVKFVSQSGKQLGLINEPLDNAVLKNLRSLIVDPPVVRVPEFGGTFQIDVRSDLFSRLIASGEYEPDLAAIAKENLHTDRDAIDVGANVGFFGCLLSKGSRKVLCCEPTPNASEFLRNNLIRNKLSNVSVFQGAVSNSNGAMVLSFIEGREEYSSLGGIDHPRGQTSEVKEISVPTKTIDELVAEHDLDPCFMKVDVEGAEFLVFDGARKTLANHRPVVLAELSDVLLKQKGSSAKEVIGLFKSLNYNVIDPLNPDIPAGTRGFGDILATPK